MESKEEAKHATAAPAKKKSSPDYTPATININRKASGGSTKTNCRWFYGTVFEDNLSFCAVRRVGDMVYSSATMAVDEEANAVVPKDEADAQTRYILQKIAAALREVRSSLQDVVHCNIYLTDVSDTIMVAYEFSAAFKEIMPAVTLLPVPELVRDDCTVMIQVTAIVQPRNYPESDDSGQE